MKFKELRYWMKQVKVYKIIRKNEKMDIKRNLIKVGIIWTNSPINKDFLGLMIMKIGYTISLKDNESNPQQIWKFHISILTFRAWKARRSTKIINSINLKIIYQESTSTKTNNLVLKTTDLIEKTAIKFP